jgi:hypothetical protein
LITSQTVISIAELTKTVSKDFDFKFTNSIPSALSATTRSTKEVAILLSVSSFRTVADATTPVISSNAATNANVANSSVSLLTSPQSSTHLYVASSIPSGGEFHANGIADVQSDAPTKLSPDQESPPISLRERERNREKHDIIQRSPPVVSIPLER